MSAPAQTRHPERPAAASGAARLPYPADLPRTWVGAFRHRVAQFGDRPFLRCGPRWRTWREVNADTDRVAAGLQALGVVKGTRLAFLSVTSEPMLDLYFGAAKVAAVQIPLNVYLKGAFLLHQLRHCKASVVIVDEPGYASLAQIMPELPGIRTIVPLAPFAVEDHPGVTVVPFAAVAASTAAFVPPEILPTDTFQVSYTSGTTGPAKGCIYSNGYIMRAGASTVYLMALNSDDVQLCVWPLNHNSGAVAVSLSFVAGSRLAMEPRFVAEGFIERAAEVGATYFVGMGPVSRQLLEQPPSPADKANSLRVSLMVPSPVAVQDELRERFGFDSTCEMWAQSECILVTGNPIDGPRFRETSGRPLPDVEVKLFDAEDREVPVGDVGEICFRPREPGVMFDGYLDDPAGTLAALRNLWYHSGDMGRADEFGNITFVDRAKDMLRRSGENISSFELEAAIRGFGAVANVAVTETAGVLERENDLVVWIVLAPGAELDVGRFAEHLWDNVPYFAVPRYVVPVAELPMTVSGRVMKHLLRREALPADALDLKQLGLLTPKERRR
jgi:crotonobetaine/carnitine-CoA ligase